MEKMIELSFTHIYILTEREREREKTNQIFDSKQKFYGLFEDFFLVFLRYTQSMFEQSFMVIIFPKTSFAEFFNVIIPIFKSIDKR